MAREQTARRGHSPSMLPLPPPLFRGRRQELARLRRLLSGHRAVAICGLGGMGKTSLALSLAKELAGEFDAAVYEKLRDGDSLGALAARVLPVLASGVVGGQRDEEGAAVALAEALRTRRALLVLDDVHLLGVKALRRLMERVSEHAGDSRLLATSRRDLSSLAPAVASLALAPLPAAEARALFRELSGAREVPSAVESGVPLVVRQLAAGAAARSPVESLLGDLGEEDRALLERLAACGPEITPADLGGTEESLTRLREHCLLEPAGVAPVLHDVVRQAVLSRARVPQRRREAMSALEGSRDARCTQERIRLAAILGDDGEALAALRELADDQGILRIGRAGLSRIGGDGALDLVPRTRAALATFEVLAIAGGTPEWIAALPPSKPGRSPEEDALALVLGYGDKAAEVTVRLSSAESFAVEPVGLLVGAMHLAQSGDARAADALERCRRAVDVTKPALAADVLSRVAWAEAFTDRSAACATLERALPLARRGGDFAAVMDLSTDLALSLLAQGELEAARAALGREVPSWRGAFLEDALALAMLLHAQAQVAQGRVPQELSLLAAMVDAPVLSPLTRYHAAGRVASALWLQGAHEAAGLLLDHALGFEVDQRATAGLSVIDALILQGRFAEAWERATAITPTRESFRSVRLAQLAFYSRDLGESRRQLAKATRTFAAMRAATDALECRLLLAEGDTAGATRVARELLSWSTRESCRPGALEAHAVLAAVGEDRAAHLGALRGLAGGKGGLAERARAMVGALTDKADDAPDSGPLLPMFIDAGALTGRAPTLRAALVDGRRVELAGPTAASLVYDFDRQALSIDGEASDLSAQARPRRVLEVLLEAAGEWVTSAELFERVFELPFKNTRVNALHAVVKRLRGILGGKASALVAARGKYRFEPEGTCVLLPAASTKKAQP